jgi:hypothetical protein
MTDTKIIVDIFNPIGLYPDRTVICENIAYLISAGIPMLVSKSQDASTSWCERDKHKELLFGALLLTRKSFPCFSFHPHPVATIHFKNADMSDAITHAVDIISLKRELPCLYDPYAGKGDASNPAEYIKQLRSSDMYIDLFHAHQIPFPDFVAKLSTQYTISHQHFRPEFVSGLYRKLNSSSRLIHIAVHYFVNAARLIQEHFIEDAGLNLNLVLEAIIEDLSSVFSIKDKRQAIKKLQATILLPYYHMEFIEELYEARNEFLAHIDKDMFTKSQNINDPDRYCFEHFESISWLIRRYVKHQSAGQSLVGVPSDSVADQVKYL